MAIEKIDSLLCDGCGACVDSCWSDVIRIDEKSGKAIIKFPEDCAVCGFCEIDCPWHAIYVSQARRPFPLTCWGL
jgi:NAD-dependent dihydropyrimidine dehydrogenase PreA subunit